MTEATEKFGKLRIALRYYLLGKNYHRGLKALALAESVHTGLRKDGKTPEVQHQIEIALHISTLRDVESEEDCIVVALLHDIHEDYNYPLNLIAKDYGSTVASSVEKISKIVNLAKKSNDSYFSDIENDPVASIVKGCDRSHNFRTMVGVFTKEKQASYLEEGRNFFLPMLKNASSKFPTQSLAYANIRHTIKMQIELIDFSLKS